MIHRKLSRMIIRAFYNVYNELGTGFLESVYENALHIALKEAGLEVEKQMPIPVFFRGIQVGSFKADLVVEGKVILELKAISQLQSGDEAQIINYLKATQIDLGLLMNFGKKPEFKRFIFDEKRNHPR